VFQNVKDKWFKAQEQKLLDEFAPKLEEIRLSIDKQTSELIKRLEIIRLEQKELESLESRVQDRRTELERVNAELKDQIRIIEAKASPDQVWTSAFQAGFIKCWENMWDFQADQVIRFKEKIRSQAINETLERLNGNLFQKT